MTRWWIYLKERFSPVSHFFLVFGITLSGIACAGVPLRGEPVGVAATGLFMFFVQLRLMDEVKDYGKDRIAHPRRPLPRGLITVMEAREVITLLAWLMAAWTAISSAACGLGAGACFMLMVGWLALMYREFFMGIALPRQPMLHGLAHLLVVVPVTAYPALCANPDSWRDPALAYWTCCALGAFFTYEVCRKLDPKAHPVLKTYLTVYGPPGTLWLLATTCAVAAVGAWGIGLGRLLWPLEAAVLLVAGALVLAPRRFRWVEGVAAASLALHLWSMAAVRWAVLPS